VLPADEHPDFARRQHAAFDRPAQRPLLSGLGRKGVLPLEPVLQRIAEPMPLVALADPGAVGAICQPFPADIVGGRADVLATVREFATDFQPRQ
jgi:hypothetical protein